MDGYFLNTLVQMIDQSQNGCENFAILNIAKAMKLSQISSLVLLQKRSP